MLKKVFIVVLVVVLLLGFAFTWLMYRGRLLSPSDTVEIEHFNAEISINYSRPSVRDRLIFGPKGSGALLPYKEYWRLGANEATEISFSQRVEFNGKPLEAGTYRMYAFPGEKNFEIAIGTETGKWGAREPDYSKELLRTKIPVQPLQEKVEQFTIMLVPTDEGISINIAWDTVQLEIPVKIL
ncbi:MAG: DUF2911 domain-containing protein [Cyclobacteriaceae bacterium]|nr:DUF2911 domain-containing protein [Cyclobacteriaceae bacterium]